MKRTALTLIAVAIVALPAAGCAGDDAVGGGGSGAAGPKAASITLVANSLPAGLDPDSTNSTDSGIQQVVTTNYVGMLFSVNGVESKKGETPKIAPDLATGATPSSDGKTWTIKIRPNVKSSAGNVLTSADVVWTINRVLAAKVNGSTLLGQVNIDTKNPATAVDPQTVALNLTAPSALVANIFSLPSLGIIDSTEAKKHVVAGDPYATKWLDANSASFGPYQVASINPNKEVVLAANPNYWKGVPQITKATYTTVQDTGTRLQTALTGQSDYTINLPETDLKTVEKAGAVDAHELPVPKVVYMTLDKANPAVSDVRVRRAIALAVDRKAISDTVYNGTAPATTSCLPKQLTTATTEYDNGTGAEVDKAKALLAQVPGDKTISIGTLPTSFPEGATMARIVQSNLAAVGIKADIKTYSSFGPITDDIKAHRLSGFMLQQAPFVVDAGYFFKAFFTSTSLYNFSSFKNPTFDAATTAAMSQPASTRETPIAQACTEFLKEAPAVMLVKAGNLAVSKKSITNVQSMADISPRLYNLRVTG